MTSKQKSNREYYRANKARILAEKKRYVEENREAVNERERRYRAQRRKPGMKCLICGGQLITDGDIWSCLEPTCEADFMVAD